MKITIVGGGNIGTQFSVHCSEKGHEVTVYTSRPELFQKELFIIDDDEVVTHHGVIASATNDPQRAFRKADVILLTLPANLMGSIAPVIYANSKASTIIGAVPGNGGSECAFRRCIDRGNIFFSIERVPGIARLVEKGKVVRSTGYRNELHVAALPGKYGQICANFVESIFDIPCIVIPDLLNMTLTPSNPILHTTRLRSMFEDWHEGVVYDYVPLFYEEWDDASSELLFACDQEVQEVCTSLREFSLGHVKSLRMHYNSPTIEAMTKKISSIPAFKGLKTPVIEIEGKFIPDLHSRYFTADFSYGLTIIKQVAEFAGVLTPNIDDTMQWYKAIAIETDEFRFADYGITDRKTFEKFYLM